MANRRTNSDGHTPDQHCDNANVVNDVGYRSRTDTNGDSKYTDEHTQ
jgi:hypothetical protein